MILTSINFYLLPFSFFHTEGILGNVFSETFCSVQIRFLDMGGSNSTGYFIFGKFPHQMHGLSDAHLLFKLWPGTSRDQIQEYLGVG